MKAQIKLMDGVNQDTVWTWNAIGKRSGAWNLSATAPEATQGFLLNHLISELLPPQPDGHRYANADPVTGQAAWYDLRVRVSKGAPEEARETAPAFETLDTRLPKPGGDLAYGAEFRARRERRMTALPSHASDRKLGLVIDLDTCVGCHACAVTCKEWNSGGHMAPLTDYEP